MSQDSIARSIEKCFAKHMPPEKRPTKLGHSRNNIHYLTEPSRFQMKFRSQIGDVFLMFAPDVWGWHSMVITHYVPKELWPKNLVLAEQDIPIARSGDINVLQRKFSLTTKGKIISSCRGILFGNHVGHGPEPTRRELIHAIQSTYEGEIIPPFAIVPREDEVASEPSQ